MGQFLGLEKKCQAFISDWAWPVAFRSCRGKKKLKGSVGVRIFKLSCTGSHWFVCCSPTSLDKVVAGALYIWRFIQTLIKRLVGLCGMEAELVVFWETALSSFEISLKDICWFDTKSTLSPRTCSKKYSICNSSGWQFAKCNKKLFDPQKNNTPAAKSILFVC